MLPRNSYGYKQAYAPNKRCLVEFKDEILMELYNAELKETFHFF